MRLLLLLTLVSCFTAQAAVISSDKNGFSISISIEVEKSAEQSYQQFIKVGEWWNSDHTWFGDASKLYIEPKIQGCFCELNGDKQALHMTVSYVEPNKEVRMIGGLGPLQMLGVHGGMSWKFEVLEENKTKITHSYQVTGYMEGGLDKLASIVDGVQTIQVEGLQKALKD